jgi:hypothetical protein
MGALLAFHVVGVVSATAVALTSASLYFVWLGRPLGLHDKLPQPRWWLAIALAAGVTILGEFGVRHTGWHGPLAVAVAGVPPLLGLLVLLLPLRRDVARRPGSADPDGG